MGLARRRRKEVLSHQRRAGKQEVATVLGDAIQVGAVAVDVIQSLFLFASASAPTSVR